MSISPRPIKRKCASSLLRDFIVGFTESANLAVASEKGKNGYIPGLLRTLIILFDYTNIVFINQSFSQTLVFQVKALV